LLNCMDVVEGGVCAHGQEVEACVCFL
jgi:hypothetical protein